MLAMEPDPSSEGQARNLPVRDGHNSASFRTRPCRQHRSSWMQIATVHLERRRFAGPAYQATLALDAALVVAMLVAALPPRLAEALPLRLQDACPRNPAKRSSRRQCRHH